MGCPKIVLKGNLSEMVSNWQVSIGYEDNQIMTVTPSPSVYLQPTSLQLKPNLKPAIVIQEL